MYSQYYEKIEIQKQIFEKILTKIAEEKNFDTRLSLAQLAAYYACSNNTGYFTSSILEKFFTDYAKTLKTDLSGIAFEKKSFLHVMSSGYRTGGHTRVVERWVRNAPQDQKHCVVFTRHKYPQLPVLISNVKEKNGYIAALKDDLSIAGKALELRKLAMHFEYVILHTHPEDPTALIAFGAEDFQRPVLFYNHSSHMFWLGKSIADLVLDLISNDDATVIYRNIKNPFVLGVPSLDMKITAHDKLKCRRKTGMPADKKIIVTAGSVHRYMAIGKISFLDMLKQVLDENTFCYAIGVDKDDPEWRSARTSTGNHIILPGAIPFDKGFLDYIRSADVYLDSWPLGGGAALMDAIASGVPALSLKSADPQLDYFTGTNGFCRTSAEFTEKIRKILSDKNYAENLLEEQQNSLQKLQSQDAWNRKTEEMLRLVPDVHKVKDLSQENDFCESNDLSVLANVIIDTGFLNRKYDVPEKEAARIIKKWLLYKRCSSCLQKYAGWSVEIYKKIRQGF